MDNLLLTGFDPFPPFDHNPSGEIAGLLDGEKINGYLVKGKALPVAFKDAAARIIQLIEEIQPAVILSLGLAAGRNKICIERFAVNYHEGTDNSGMQYEGTLIDPGGPAAYFATVPVRSVAGHILESGLPAEISNNAGIYVCNYIFYRVLHFLEQAGKRDVHAGFLHLPADHRIAISHSNIPGWSAGDLALAVRLAVEALDHPVDSTGPLR